MAIRRLVNMVQAIDQNIEAAKGNNQVSPLADNLGASTVAVETGTVVQSLQSGCLVTFRGGVGSADLATDEPLQAGQRVYVMQIDDGSLVVLGPVKVPLP